jgi:hypothetical protein
MKNANFLPLIRIGWVLSGLVLGTSLSANSQQNLYRFSLESVDGRIVLTIQTAEPLLCIGSSIRNRVQWEEDTVVVMLSGFVRPIPCIQGLEPASARIDVEQKARKVFYVKFREDAFSNLWKISVNDSGFQALPIQDSFTSYLK